MPHAVTSPNKHKGEKYGTIKKTTSKESTQAKINWSLVIPGIIIVIALLIFALTMGDMALPALNAALD